MPLSFSWHRVLLFGRDKLILTNFASVVVCLCLFKYKYDRLFLRTGNRIRLFPAIPPLCEKSPSSTFICVCTDTLTDDEKIKSVSVPIHTISTFVSISYLIWVGYMQGIVAKQSNKFAFHSSNPCCTCTKHTYISGILNGNDHDLNFVVRLLSAHVSLIFHPIASLYESVK